MKLKARPLSDIPDKPGYLVAYEMIPEHRRPYIVAGELMEQPHLWLLEYEAIDQVEKVFKRNDDQTGN